MLSTDAATRASLFLHLVLRVDHVLVLLGATTGRPAVGARFRRSTRATTRAARRPLGLVHLLAQLARHLVEVLQRALDAVAVVALQGVAQGVEGALDLPAGLG